MKMYHKKHNGVERAGVETRIGIYRGDGALCIASLRGMAVAYCVVVVHGELVRG